MFGHLRVRSPWSQLGIFTGLLGAAFIFSAVLLVLIVLSQGVNPANLDFSNPRILHLMKWLQGGSSVTIFFLPAFFYAMITFRGKYLYFLGVKPAPYSRMYVMAVFMIILSFPVVGWLGELNEQLPVSDWMRTLEKDATRQMTAFLKAKDGFDVFINVVVIALLPAICEEICFRGALQRILINLFKNPWAGIIVTAIIFSAFHMQFLGFLPRMFLGVLLGALYWYSGSIWASIAAHFVNNAVQVLVVSYMPEYIDKNPPLSLYLVIASVVLVFGVFWYYRKLSTESYAKVYEADELNERNEWIA